MSTLQILPSAAVSEGAEFIFLADSGLSKFNFARIFSRDFISAKRRLEKEDRSGSYTFAGTV